MEDAALIESFGAMTVDPTGSGLRTTTLQVDDRAPNNVTAHADTPEQMRDLLALRFGQSELAAMLRDPAMNEVNRNDETGEPDWFQVARVIEHTWRHEFRTPLMHEVRFAARFHDKVKADPAIRMWRMVGMSSHGWMAALCSHGDSPKRYLFFRRAADGVEAPWVQAAGFEPLTASAKVVATNIEGSVVTVLLSAAGGDVCVLAFDLETPKVPARTLELPANAPEAVSVAGNKRRVLVVHASGELTILNPVGYAYAFTPCQPVAPQPKATKGTNPLTGEPLEVDAADEDVQFVPHQVRLAVHDQCDPDAIALSTHLGYIVHVKMPPPETPAEEAVRTIASTMKFYAMGEDATLGDQKYKHPPREAAISLCSRTASGLDSTFAQANWHMSYRCDAAATNPIAARYNAYQAADAGPFNCVAVLGTVLVLHSYNNKMLIASMVPDLQDPSRVPVRFRSGTHGQSSPISAVTTPYPSLAITLQNIFWLLPDGALMICTPCTDEQHAQAQNK